MADQLLCPSCCKPVAEAMNFCPHCNAPLTTFATTDPMASIQARGEMVRRSFRRPGRLVLIGMWLWFGLGLAAFIFFLFLGITEGFGDPVGSLLGFSLLVFAIALYSAVLYRVTASYFHPERKRSL